MTSKDDQEPEELIREPDKSKSNIGERLWGPYRAHAGTDISEKYTGGPHGLGDPEDRTMRKVEREILVAQIIKDQAKTSYCKQEFADFWKCCDENSNMLKVAFGCQGPGKVLRECMAVVQKDPKVVAECTEIYLERRAEYRRTGLRKRLKRM